MYNKHRKRIIFWTLPRHLILYYLLYTLQHYGVSGVPVLLIKVIYVNYIKFSKYELNAFGD